MGLLAGIKKYKIATYSNDASGNVVGLGLPNGSSWSLTQGPKPNRLVTAVCGNSIAAQCQKSGAGADNSYWSFKNTIHHANTLCGSPLQFVRVTATTRGDGYGVYGYSGQTLATINGDIATQWFAQFTASTGYPDLVIGYGLVENDIAGAVSVSTMQNSLVRWVRLVQATWPGARIILSTPHLSFSYNTPTLVANYQAIRDYIIGLEDGTSIFVCRMDAYENPESPGTPLGTGGSPIYTDSSVHPNSKGAFLLGRNVSATLKRLIGSTQIRLPVYSNNLILDGSQTATATNTGTMPNPAEMGSPGSNGSRVGLAEQPGMLINTTTAVMASANSYVDTGAFSSGWGNATGTELCAFSTIQIVSGAENIGIVQLEPRYSDGTNSFFLYPLHFNTGDKYPTYRNGDIITIIAPPEVTTHLAFTHCNPYVRVAAHDSAPIGAQFSYRVINSGCMVNKP